MNLQFPSRQTAANDRIWHCIADCFNRPVTAFYPFMPTISPVGFGPLGLSTALLAIRLAEEFVDLVAKSKLSAFTLEKPISGIRCVKATPLMAAFYQLVQALRQCAFNIKLPHYELGENTQALLAAFRHLGADHAHFTGNPNAILGAGLHEGDFINGVITRIREETTKKGFKTRKTTRIKEARQAVSKADRLLKRLREIHVDSAIGSQWFDLAYTPEAAASVNVKTSAKHLEQLLEQVNAMPSVLGYFWIRQFDGISYRTRLAIFRKAQDCHQNDLAVETAWQDITQKKGSALTKQPEIIYLLHLQQQIEPMLMSTIHLRLERNPKFEHLGFSDLPAKTPALSSKETGSPAWPSLTKRGVYFVGKQLI